MYNNNQTLNEMTLFKLIRNADTNNLLEVITLMRDHHGISLRHISNAVGVPYDMITLALRRGYMYKNPTMNAGVVRNLKAHYSVYM